MIEEHFGLERAPFRLGTDVSFYYESEAHRRAMAHLRYGLRQAEGFVVVTGEPGVGKTILVEHLLGDLGETDVLAATLPPGPVTPETLAARVLAAFEEEADEGEDALRALTTFLERQKARGLRASLIVDEAQRLGDQTLEELRLLSNLSADGEALLQVCLIGQTALRSVLYRADMEQFRQRIVASYHLAPLSAEDTRAYLNHRMLAAGWQGDADVFTPEAAGEVHRRAGGVPRRINTLASRVLMQAALDGERSVGADEVRGVADELSEAGTLAEQEAPAAPPPPVMPLVTPKEPAAVMPSVPEPRDEAAPSDDASSGGVIRFPGRPAADAERRSAEEDRAREAAAREAAEEAEAERALAMITAEVAETETPQGPEADDDEDEGRADDAERAAEPVAASARTSGPTGIGGGQGHYPVSVSEINAAIQSIEPNPNQQRGVQVRALAPDEEPPRRRITSPMEMMLATGPGGRAKPRLETEARPTPRPREVEPAPREPVTSQHHATIEGFLAEAGDALSDLRAALDTIRRETEALDGRRRQRREAIGERIEEARRRLAVLRGE